MPKCGRCGLEVSDVKAHEGVCIRRWDDVPEKEQGEESLAAGLATLTKEEALAEASRLIRDEDVPANQKGPLLAVLARVAGWETAPEYDFEKERARWMRVFEKMVEEDEREVGRLRKAMKGRVLVEVREMVGDVAS